VVKLPLKFHFKGFVNPFRPESLYCLGITKIYNPDALEEITGGTTYYTQ